MDWKKYEEVVEFIYKTLGKVQDVKIECSGTSCKCKGKSGVKHQLDVLTSHEDGIHKYKTYVECKYWDKNINKDIVMKVSEIIEDCNIDKGVVVSKLGFTPDAITYAKYKGIGLVRLGKLTEKDKKERVWDINIHLTRNIVNYKAKIICDKKIINNDLEKKLISLEIKDSDLFIYPERSQKTLDNLIDEIDPKISLDDTKVINFNDGTYLKSDNFDRKIPVKGIELKKTVIKKDLGIIQIEGEGEVDLIMEVISENKSFIITKSGEIRDIS